MYVCAYLRERLPISVFWFKKVLTTGIELEYSQFLSAATTQNFCWKKKILKTYVPMTPRIDPAPKLKE